MKYTKLFSSLALLLLSLSPSIAQPAKATNGAEQAYISYVNAWKARDFAKLDQLIASDYMTLNGERKLAHKANELAEAKADTPYAKMQVEEIHSLIVGDTAVVSGVTSVVGQDQSGKSYSVQVRFLGTLLKRHGQWQLVADQSAS